jgi:hypothetical protein
MQGVEAARKTLQDVPIQFLGHDEFAALVIA